MQRRWLAGALLMTILASAVMGDLKIGDSISVNGTCLTVVNKNEHNFSVEVSPETLSVSTLGQLAAGAPLNLRVTYRDSHPPDGAQAFVGFRCAKS